MKKILGALAVVAMITLMAPAPAEAQAVGDVAVSIDFTNGILILYYYDTITFDMDLASISLSAPCTGGTGGEWGCVQPVPAGDPLVSYPAAGEILAVYTDPTSALSTDLTAIELTLQSVWAVRAIGGGAGGVDVTITGPATLDGTAPSAITTPSWLVQSENEPIAAASINFPDPGLGDSELGDVVVTLDLSTVTDFTTPHTGTYTITAENL